MLLTLPGSNRPTNLHLTPDQINWQLDGDTVEWLRQLPLEVERGEKLYVLYHKDHPKPWVIMEADVWDPELDNGRGGYVDMFVLRTDHLSSETYTRLRRARQIPLLKRLEWAERENEQYEKSVREQELEQLYYTLGEPMQRELIRNGFTGSSVGSKSYPIVSRQKQRYKSQAKSSSGVILPAGVR
jgi:hypothetical protein